MKIKQKMVRLALVSALVLGTFSTTYGMDLTGARESTNVLDCRGSLVCGGACDAHRTTWQSVQCFVGIL